MILSNNEYNFLKTELDNTPIMSDNELKYVKLAHPQLYYTTKNIKNESVALYTEKSYVYHLTNEKLNKFICDKFDEPIKNLYMMHRLFYGKGGFAKKHRDRFTTHKTISIIMNDEFTGGDMYINNKLVNMNKQGEYVSFNGSTDEHEITEITNGVRDVLIVWFSKKQSKFEII